jgi:hypothetical protein
MVLLVGALSLGASLSIRPAPALAEDYVSVPNSDLFCIDRDSIVRKGSKVSWTQRICEVPASSFPSTADCSQNMSGKILVDTFNRRLSKWQMINYEPTAPGAEAARYACARVSR